MKDKICHIDMQNLHQDYIYDKMHLEWGKYDIYHIFNVNADDPRVVYEKLANTLGTIKICHPVNNRDTKISNSRDIKFDPDIPHFFASNSRQPLHTDYAYYKEETAPDWLMLYCMTPSKYGGITDVLSLDTLRGVMREHDPQLLKDIEVDIVWRYESKGGDIIHTKPILNENKINWNYWQIRKELNLKTTIKIAERFFRFLEDVVVESRIYDFSKKWQTGDCIIFKDSSNLHGRTAFLGDRWLKDHAFYYEQTKENKK